MLIRFGLQSPLGVPSGDTVWQMEWEARINVLRPPVAVRFLPPADTASVRVVKQDLIYPRLRLERGTNNELVAVGKLQKEYYLLARYYMKLRSSQLEKVHPPLENEERQLYLRNEPDIQLDSSIVKNRAAELAARVTDASKLPEMIFNEVANILIVKSPSRSGSHDAETVIEKGRGSELGKARAMIALCRTQNVPARMVTGFKLEDDININPIYWVEVLQDRTWIPYDPTRGYSSSVPSNYLPVRHDGNEHVFVVDGDADIKIDYQILQDDSPVGVLSSRQRRLRDLFDLSRLPLDMRNTLALILVLPFGALITYAFRQFTGLYTYGTFTPSLLALAAVYADPVTAMVIFGLVIVIGFAGRGSAITSALTRLPRLAVVFTLVALGMTLAVSVMDYFYLNPMGHVVLLPIVVLTSFIDRVYTTFDDLGMKQVIIRLITTVIVTLCCFALFRVNTLSDWVVNYPETHLITLGLVICLSLYKNKKLVDIGGFEWLKADTTGKNKKKSADASA